MVTQTQPQPWSLNRQVLLPLVGACLVAAVALAAISQWLAARQAAADSRARLASVAAALSDTSFPVNASVLEILQRLSGLEFIVCDSQLNLRGSSTGIDATTARQALTLLQLSDRSSSRLTQVDGRELVLKGQAYRATTLHRPSSTDALLILLEPQAQRQALQQQLALMPLLTGLATLILVGAVALAVSQRLVRRITDAQRQVQQIAAGQLERVSIAGPEDQLTSLTHSVNSMADELRSMWRTLRETERSRLLSQVAGGLAHQLRNAITGIHLAVQLHRRDCPLGASESLAVAESELARTSAYIQQLLHSAAGKTQSPQSGTIAIVIDEAQSLLQAIANHRRIPIVWQRDQQSESIVVCDRDLLRSAIMNLVLNALDAAGPGGNVHVLSYCVNTMTHLSISDSGVGPGVEVGEHLFDPFVSSKPEGLGVGLTVVRSAAEAFGGSIRWYRESDRTIFDFQIPRESRY